MSGKDFEIEEGKEVVGRTIVGGRPLARKKRKLKIPIGIEKVLCKAAVDPVFRASLYENRKEALKALGGELSEAEAAILMSIPVESMETMVARIDPPKHTRRSFMKGVMAATLAAASAAALADCSSLEPSTMGVGADVPPDAAEAHETYVPETAVKGIQPDDVFVEPDVVETQDGQVILGIDPELDVIEHEDLMAPGGIIPDAK